MVLTEQEIKDTLMSKELSDTNQLNLIQTYIHERKKVPVRIHRPKNTLQVQLMIIAFNAAVDYYSEKYFKR